MAALTHISPGNITILERALALSLPADYVRFVTTHPLPALRYMDASELTELFELDTSIILETNENLRDPTLNPFPWKESFFAIGEHPNNEAIYYLDTHITTTHSPVFQLEPASGVGVRIADRFTAWAHYQLEILAQEDARCQMWHEAQQPAWWRWLMAKIGK